MADMSTYAGAIAAGQGTPSSPLGDFPELRGYYNAGFAGPAVMGNSAVKNVPQTEAYNASQTATANDLNTRAQALKDAMTGKNYQQVAKNDGGFDFYDPLGNKITLHQYTQAVGKNPVDVLKDSQNNLDQQYIRDFNDMQDLVNATYNHDSKTLDSIFSQRPGLKDAIKGLTPDQLIQQFRSYYPNVYGDTGQTANTRNFQDQKSQLYQPAPPPPAQPNLFQRAYNSLFNRGK